MDEFTYSSYNTTASLRTSKHRDKSERMGITGPSTPSSAPLDAAEVRQLVRGDDWKLPRRDWFLLPAISLLTVFLMLSVGEIVARMLWPMQDEDSCRVTVSGVGSRFRPNCHSTMKVPESSWIENAYNDCGYRTRESCGPKQPGTLRIAVLGTSFSYGYMNSYQDAFTTIAGKDLSKQCQHPVEFQNLGVPNLSIVGIYRRLDEALALKPDLIVLAMTPMDLRSDVSSEAMLHRNQPVTSTEDTAPEHANNRLKWLVVEPLKQSRAIYMIQHFLYQNTGAFLDLYLLYGDKVGYLRDSLSPTWQRRFSDLDLIISDMASRSKAASVPMAVLVGPVTSQVALLNSPAREGYDALSFAKRIQRTTQKDGIPLMDPIMDMKGVAKPMGLFYVNDGHLNSRGQAILAKSFVRLLRSSEPGLFRGCAAQ